MKLKNRTALITGASGVIGRAIATAFSRAGADLLLIGRSVAPLESLRQELGISGRRIEIKVVDVGQINEVKALMEYVTIAFERVDILVTAAGVYGEIGTIEQVDAERWLDAIRINLWGTMLFIKYTLPLLKKSDRAAIITFAGGGDGALPNFTSYASSKGAVLRFTESVAAELRPYQITINAISPGLINSGFVEDLIAAGPDRVGKEKYDQAIQEMVGERETFSPEKAASLAVFLASDEGRVFTGKNISAIWDKWEDFTKHFKEISQSDIYNWRRIKPKDRGYEY